VSVNCVGILRLGEGISMDNEDWKRLLWLVKESGIEIIGDVDILEQAVEYVDGNDDDIPGDLEDLKAIRYAIDRGMEDTSSDRVEIGGDTVWNNS